MKFSERDLYEQCDTETEIINIIDQTEQLGAENCA